MLSSTNLTDNVPQLWREGGEAKRWWRARAAAAALELLPLCALLRAGSSDRGGDPHASFGLPSLPSSPP